MADVQLPQKRDELQSESEGAAMSPSYGSACAERSLHVDPSIDRFFRLFYGVVERSDR
jgi:hypothetical protein